MLSSELLEQVKGLEESEKLRLVQLLIADLKLVGGSYETLTPFGNEAAARILEEMLEESKAESRSEIE